MTFLNRHRSRIRPVGPFAPSSLFFGGIPGAWYDPTDLSTMFQDNTGLTPVTAVEQPVGLIFDKSQGTPTARYNLLTYSEQFDNGIWARDVAGTGVLPVVTANAGVAPDGTMTADRIQFDRGAGAGSFSRIRQYAIPAPTGTCTWSVWMRTVSGLPETVTLRYEGTAVLCNVTGAWQRFSVSQSATFGECQIMSWTTTGGTQAPDVLVWGAQLQTGSTATTYQKITTGTGGEWTPGNHASQSTAASRPTYRARYNALTQSETFTGAPWLTGSTAGAITRGTISTQDPTGATSNVSTVAFPAVGAGQFSIVYQDSGATYLNVNVTWSVWLRVASGTATIYLNVEDTAAAPAGGNAFVSPPLTLTTTWQRFTLTGTRTANTGNLGVFFGFDTRANVGQTNAAPLTVQVWGAQLLTAADVTATGNAYQRIAAATVYDTAPVFRPYLAFDGLDDSLSTAAINFTTTDKVSVFLGVSRMAETAFGSILECRNPVGFPSFAIFSPVGPNYQFRSSGTIDSNQSVSGYAAPITNTVTMLGDIGAPLLGARINAVQVLNNTNTQGTGTYANASMFIGRRDTGASPFNGRYYEIIVRGAASSVTEIADTELWVNARTGAF